MGVAPTIPEMGAVGILEKEALTSKDDRAKMLIRQT